MSRPITGPRSARGATVLGAVFGFLFGLLALMLALSGQPDQVLGYAVPGACAALFAFAGDSGSKMLGLLALSFNGAVLVLCMLLAELATGSP